MDETHTNSWDKILNFSMKDALEHIQKKSPILLPILISDAYKRGKQPVPDEPGSLPGVVTYNDYFARPIVTGVGHNVRDQFMV